ncbi:WD40 repeat domain-containing protein [uncultured Bradyrhizobium sp.]|uniref:WD40 repeat domain-containing protein n=1 Tax=uncultured Bradyrhizobium sp. TaxID=199684 RepID=UPI0035C9B0A4
MHFIFLRELRILPFFGTACLAVVQLAFSSSVHAVDKVTDKRNAMKVVYQLPHQKYVHGLAWSFDGSKLATLSAFGSLVTIWDAKSGQKLKEMSQYSAAYAGTAISWTRDGLLLSSAGPKRRDEDIYAMNLWDPATGSLIKKIEGPPLVAGGQPTNQASMFHVSASGALLAMTTSSANKLVLYDTSNWSIMKTIKIAPVPPSGTMVFSFAFSPDERSIAVANGRHLQLIDLKDESIKFSALTYQQFGIRAGPVMGSIAFSPDGRSIATAPIFFPSPDEDTGAVRIWSAADGSLVAKLSDDDAIVPPANNPSARMVDWSPDGTRLAVARVSNIDQVWEFGNDVSQSKIIFSRRVGPAGLVAFAQDGTLAVGDGTSVLILKSDH